MDISMPSQLQKTLDTMRDNLAALRRGEAASDKQTLDSLQQLIDRIAQECDQCELRSQRIQSELMAHQEEVRAQDDALAESHARSKELEEYLNAVFRHAPMGYLVLEQECTIVDHNNLAIELLQASGFTLVGQTLQHWLQRQSWDAFRGACSRALRQSDRQSLELQVKRDADGKSVWLQTELHTLELPAQGRTLLLCSLSDISHQRRTYKELLEAKVQLEQEIAERKAAERLFRHQQSRFRKLIEENADALLVVGEDGVVLYANPAARDLLAQEQGKLEGARLGFTIVPSEIEIEPRGDSPPRVAELRYAEIEWGNEPARLVTMRDITARKKVEQELKLAHDVLEQRVEERTAALQSAYTSVKDEMEERKRTSEQLQRIRQAVESSGDAIVIADNLQQASYCNAATQSLFGYTCESLNEAGGLEALYPSQEELDSIRETLAEHGSYSGEVTVRTSDGDILPVLLRADAVRNEDGPLAAMVAIHKDVTEIKDAREAMLSSREEFRNLADNLPDMVARIDRELCYSFANRALAEAWGAPVEQAYGLCLRNMDLPEDIQSLWIDALEEVLEQGVVREFEFSYTNEGRTNYFHSRVAPEFDHHGNVVSCVSLSSNVTARVEMERELRHSQKMEALGAMAGKVAHDFNNMLGIIMTSAELLKLSLADAPQEHLRRLTRILEAANQAKDIISRMLTFARMDQPEKKHVDLESELRKCTALLRDALPPSVTLEYRCESAGILAWVDSTQLQQIVMNLGLNAKDALTSEDNKQGRIIVSLDSLLLSTTETTQQFPDLEPGWFGRLMVIDDGPGIPEENLERIFDPFFTTKGKGRGSGLGLSMVHRILRQHKGAVRVQSAPDQGTTFTIYVPLSGQSVQELVKQEQLPESLDASVLLVDDEPTFLESVQETLQNYGCMVLSASNGIQALQILEQCCNDGVQVDLLFTDQTMPSMTGVELITKAHEMLPDLPAVLSTGFSDYLTTDRARQLQAVFLPKPFSCSQLLLAVSEALQQS